MPYPFATPTTSSVLLSEIFASDTHPSLLLATTTRRSVLKDVLKRHKRLALQAKSSNLSTVQDALNDYIPYLMTVYSASGDNAVGNERVDIEIKKPLEVEWRTTLSASLPGREPSRVKLIGIHHEIAFTLSTLAYVHSLLARSQLRALQSSSTVLSTEQRTAAIGTAMKYFLDAHSIHKYLLALPTVAAAQDGPPDIQASTISALSSLALAEATLIVVQKDDPYTAAVAEDRNESATDWMFKAPSIPKVRAHLFARICLAAASHAGQASALLARATTGRIDESLVKYTSDLARTARAKAVRFLAIDAELSGSTGQALAFLRGARKELGLPAETEEGRRRGLRGLRQSWQERREDKKVEKGGEWGGDAGRLEEARVLEMLEAKWDKQNSMVNVQTVPPFEPLLANLPTGREYHTPQPYQPPTLDAIVLQQMRAPPDPSAKTFYGDEEDSGDEAGDASGTPGAFPVASGSNYY